MNNILARIFTYLFLLTATIIGLWLSYKVGAGLNFLIYGVLSLIISFSIIFTAVITAIKSSISYNYIDLGCSFLLLGLNVWSVFSAFRLWL